MRSQAWWDIARAGGFIAWVLAALAVVGGLQLSTRLVRRPAPAWVLDVHRFVGGLSVVFVVVHLVGLAADSFIGFGVGDLLVPGVSSYRPTEVALGIVAFYLLVAVEITSLLMKRVPRRIWHGIHLSSYAVFALGTVHGITAGTDGRDPVFEVACVLTAGLVLFMTLVRILAPRREIRSGTPRAQPG